MTADALVDLLPTLSVYFVIGFNTARNSAGKAAMSVFVPGFVIIAAVASPFSTSVEPRMFLRIFAFFHPPTFVEVELFPGFIVNEVVIVL